MSVRSDKKEAGPRPRHPLSVEAFQWLLIGILAAVAATLGYIGFLRHALAEGIELSLSDLSYLTLQLFAIESGSATPPVPLELNIARFLAPIATAGAILKTFAVIFRDRLRLLRIGLMRNHVIVCGLGRKGVEIARDFRRSGDRVIAIESDAENDNIRVCHDLDIPVLIGDATDGTLLKRARAHRARHVIATCGDDGTNVDIAISAYRLVAARKPRIKEPVRCSIQVSDLRLSTLLEQHRILTGLGDRFRASIFSVYQTSARALLAEHPLDHLPIGSRDARTAHLVIVGFGQMGECVALQAAKIACFANGRKVKLDIIDRRASLREKQFAGEHPAVLQLCDVSFIEGDAHDPEILDRIQSWADDESTVTNVTVCFDDDPRALSCALSILTRLEDRSTPLLVRMADSVGLATLLECEEEHCEWAKHVHAFGMVDRVCSREALLREEQDALARAIHEDYEARARAAGRSEDDAAVRPWDLLDESLKNSNRQAADHIPVKLRAIGCVSSTEEPDGEEVTEFTHDEIELLSRMEHARWCAERTLAKWTSGPRDHAKKTTPYLVDFDDLPPEIQDYDRDAVRAIPRYLDAVGRKIYRLAPAPA